MEKQKQQERHQTPANSYTVYPLNSLQLLNSARAHHSPIVSLTPSFHLHPQRFSRRTNTYVHDDESVHDDAFAYDATATSRVDVPISLFMFYCARNWATFCCPDVFNHPRHYARTHTDTYIEQKYAQQRESAENIFVVLDNIVHTEQGTNRR